MGVLCGENHLERKRLWRHAAPRNVVLPGDFTSIFLIYQCARDTGEADKKRFRHDPAVARSDAKMKRILDRCYIGSLHSFVKTVIPSTGFVESKEMSNWEDAGLLDLLYRQ